MKKRILLALLVTLLGLSQTYSQISLKIGPQVGLTSPTVDYSGDAKDFYSGTKYGLKLRTTFSC